MTQFRKKNKRSLLSICMSFIYRKILSNCGENVMFDSIVYLMRNPQNIKLDDGVYIKANSRICPCNEDAQITIGKNTTIGYNTIIFSSQEITIGDNCMIAPNVYIVDSDHGMNKDQLMNQQENITNKIIIGNDVWIAAGAVILKGTMIPDGCIVAANSVVKGQLEAYSIYGGAPARKIGDRQ